MWDDILLDVAGFHIYTERWTQEILHDLKSDYPWDLLQFFRDPAHMVRNGYHEKYALSPSVDVLPVAHGLSLQETCRASAYTVIMITILMVVIVSNNKKSNKNKQS